MSIKASEIEKAVKEQCRLDRQDTGWEVKGEGKSLYSMSLVGEDAKIVERLVNQGIDAYLEACFIPDRGDSYEWGGGAISGTSRLVCLVSPQSMAVLLRRLVDDEKGDETEDCDTWAGPRLASDILGTLGWADADVGCDEILSRVDEQAPPDELDREEDEVMRRQMEGDEG